MMKSFIRFIKRIFGVYETGYEYWVYLKDIKINPETEYRNPIFKIKHWNHYEKYGKFDYPIFLNRNFELVSGYESYLVAKFEKLNKVPVYVVEEEV